MSTDVLINIYLFDVYLRTIVVYSVLGEEEERKENKSKASSVVELGEKTPSHKGKIEGKKK